jgi:hypothetical protein
VWSNPQHLDLFATDSEGRVISTWWEGGKGWQAWFLIQPRTGKVQPGQQVTAVWSNPQHLDLFATDSQGRVISTWWEGGKGWQAWFTIQPRTGKAQPRQQVTALWSSPQHLDLFATDAQGRVISTWWEGGKGWQAWFAIHPETGKVQSGQQVTAAWSNPQHLDLFATDAQGRVMSTWWEASKNWQHWFGIYRDEDMQRLGDPNNVVTQLNNNSRTGAYLAEAKLTPKNVNSAAFGKLYQRIVQGQVLAQPLYVRKVATKTHGVKNMILIATAANMVYAFDADEVNAAPTAGLLFMRQVNNSGALSPQNPEAWHSVTLICPETYPPYIGITSTPVIDAASNTMYVVSFDSNDRRHYLHALDLADDLRDRVPPVVIEPPDNMITQQERDAAPDKPYSFALHHRNRPGLLRLNGIVYVAFASFICDNPTPFAGWVFGYSSDLKQVAVWRTPENITGGGIWQSGRGLVGAPDGSIYFETGNDEGANLTTGHLGNSFIRLQSSCSENLRLAGAFESSNSVNLSNGDTDLGSSGPILVDDRLIGAGKQGRIYVLDSDTMTLSQNATSTDGFQGFPGFVNTYHNDPKKQACTNLTINYKNGNNVGHRLAPDGGHPDKYCRDVNSIQAGKPGYNWTEVCTYNKDCYLPTSCYQFCQTYGPNVHAGFVYWRAYDHGYLYAMPEKDYLRAFQFDLHTRHVEENPYKVSQFRVPDGMPGGAIAVSANDNRDGVIWVSMPRSQDATGGIHAGTLLAADALDLHELWRDDCVRYFAKFNPPIIADGKVILATFADPSGQAVPGENCQAPDPTIDWNKDYGAGVDRLDVGSAWVIVYGLK